jgi:hypothetical protein
MTDLDYLMTDLDYLIILFTMLFAMIGVYCIIYLLYQGEDYNRKMTEYGEPEDYRWRLGDFCNKRKNKK